MYTYTYMYLHIQASLEAQTVKNQSIMQETWVWFPGSARSPGEGNGNPLQCSPLENPMDRWALWTIVHGVAKSDRTDQQTLSHTYTFFLFQILSPYRSLHNVELFFNSLTSFCSCCLSLFISCCCLCVFFLTFLSALRNFGACDFVSVINFWKSQILFLQSLPLFSISCPSQILIIRVLEHSVLYHCSQIFCVVYFTVYSLISFWIFYAYLLCSLVLFIYVKGSDEVLKIHFTNFSP